MNKIKKALFFLLIIFFVIFIAASIFVAIKGKTIAQEMMQKTLNRKVDVGSIKLRLPFSLEVNSLVIENLITAKQVILTPSILGFISGRITLNRLQLVNPEFFIIRQEDGSWNLPISKEKSSIALAGIVINNGVLNFIDKKVDPAGFVFKIQDIQLNVHTSLISTRPLNVSFYLKSKIVSQQDNKPPAIFTAHGWVDLLRKDMKGKIELSGLDALKFLPYYEKYLPSPLKNGWIFFKSDLNAKNNDLTANCHLRVKDLIFEQKEEGFEEKISFLDIVTGGLKNENQEVALDFVVKTKLDKPRIDVARLTGSVVAKSLEQSLIKSPEQTIDKVKNLGKDLESLGKDFLKKKVGDIFGTKEKQEE